MAHAFLKKMLETEGAHSRLEVISCLAGGFFLLNSYAIKWFYADPAFPGLLAAAAALLLGTPLVWHALTDLWRGEAEMNELAALSFVASFSTGEYRTAAIIAFFMIISELIEYRSQLGARKNIESLMRLTPDRAVRLDHGAEVEVKCADLRQHDLVRIRPGDSIPGDGVICAGVSSINEAAITGESLPRDKKIGDPVFGGTINLSGVLEVRITQAAEDTTLARIKDLIMRAEESRTPIMRIIDQYAGWYTPVVLMLATIVLFFSRDISRAISMLIIACPCTVLLSSPTALVAALSAAARVGVIIKNVAVLETAGAVKALVFDKTGTLTVGRLNPVDIEPVGSSTEEELLTLAAAAEFSSRHPVAQAIVAEAQRRGLTLPAITAFEERAGCGVQAVIDGRRVLTGKAEWLHENGVDVPAEKESDEHHARSAVQVASDGHLCGRIVLSDTIRRDAPAMMAQLRDDGIDKIVMVSGDRAGAVARVGAQLQCEVEAEVLPEDKMKRVAAIREQGYVTAVVGDGVNDAPALAAGDISIAMGAAGSDVAIHSASIVLMNDRLDRIPFVLRLSHRTINIMRQNLAFSSLYIVVLLIISAAGGLPPGVAAILHTVSAFLVVFNSARLLREGEKLS